MPDQEFKEALKKLDEMTATYTRPDVPVTLEYHDGKFVLEDKHGNRRIWNNGMNSLVGFIASKKNHFTLDPEVFNSLPSEKIDYRFTFTIDVRASQGESEEEIYRWIMNTIADIPDVVEIAETQIMPDKPNPRPRPRPRGWELVKGSEPLTTKPSDLNEGQWVGVSFAGVSYVFQRYYDHLDLAVVDEKSDDPSANCVLVRFNEPGNALTVDHANTFWDQILDQSTILDDDK